MFSSNISCCRCLIPECERSGAPDFSPQWILNAVPAQDSSFHNCLRFEPSPHSRTAGNVSCPKEWFNHSVAVSCSDHVYENHNTIVYDVSNFNSFNFFISCSCITTRYYFTHRLLVCLMNTKFVWLIIYV